MDDILRQNNELGTKLMTLGLIRQYLPKGTDFNKLTDKQVLEIMDKLNNRPRKCLGYKTPNQVFFGIKPPVALARIFHQKERQNLFNPL